MKSPDRSVSDPVGSGAEAGLDPVMAARIRDAFDGMPVLGLIGAELLMAAPGRCDIGLAYRRDLTQQQGFLHAGVVSTLADTAGGLAARTLMPADKTVLAVEFKINLISPALGDRFEAMARVVKAGRTLTICEVDVFAIRAKGSAEGMADARRHCARMQQTCIAVDQH